MKRKKFCFEFNEREQELVDKINTAKGLVVGELEINYNEEKDAWFAMDYKEWLGGAFMIHSSMFDSPLITTKEIEEKSVDLNKCFCYTSVFVCG